MDQAGEYVIDAEREAVWRALNDPDVLARSIDGCQAMRKLSDAHYQARVKAKVGPVSAPFDVDLKIEDPEPPERYRIVGQVKGGAAGFGKGTADVALHEREDGQTLLTYAVQASVGGKLAQVGSRLLDGAARKMADDFFARFSATLGTPPPPAEPFATDEEHPENTAVPERQTPNQLWLWVLVFGALALALVLAL